MGSRRSWYRAVVLVPLWGPSCDTSAACTTLSLNLPARTKITVAYATVDGTAIAGNRYVATSGTLSFPKSTTKLSLPVAANAQLTQKTKSFSLKLSNPSPGSVLGDRQGTATVVVDRPSCTLVGGGAADTLTGTADTLPGTADTGVVVSCS